MVQSAPVVPAGTDDDSVDNDEDASIRRTVEVLLESPEDVKNGEGFVCFEELLLADDLRRFVNEHYVWPLVEQASGDASESSGGLLLCGPPGTGKTALAKAISVASGAILLPIGNSNVLSQWAGKADRTIKAIFEVARAKAPCVIFFDEVEKLLQSTASGSTDAHSNATNEFKRQADPNGGGRLT